jgi:predicted NAD/FAD-dependent oxidoreductase
MSGLATAKDLVGMGHDVVVFDMGCAVGGRMVSKRLTSNSVRVILGDSTPQGFHARHQAGRISTRELSLRMCA